MNIKGAIKIIHRNLPTIISVAGAAGNVVSVGLAIRDTKKVCKTYYEGKDLSKKEIAKAYVLTAVSTVGSVGLILLGDRLHVRKEAKIVAAGALACSSIASSAKAKELAAAAGGTALAVKNKVDAETAVNDADDETMHTFYDAFSDTYFESTWQDVLRANLLAQDEYNTEGDAMLCNYYDHILGFPKEVADRYRKENFMWDCNMLMECHECYNGVPFSYDMSEPRQDGSYGIYFEIDPWPEDFVWRYNEDNNPDYCRLAELVNESIDRHRQELE